MFRSLTLIFTFSKGRLVYSSITVPDIFVCEKTLVLLKTRRKRSITYKENFFNNLCLKFIYELLISVKNNRFIKIFGNIENINGFYPENRGAYKFLQKILNNDIKYLLFESL